MAEPHVISGLKAKRARIAGEIIQAQEIVARRTEQLLAIDAVLRIFTPGTDPNMIAPIRPSTRGLFFQYRELGRICLDVLREAKGPVTLDHIASVAMEIKGFPDDRRLRRQIGDTARQSLMRMAREGKVRAVVKHPDTWWELVG